ncbi:hypothetical protein GALMADRAFT_138633 [Galerina marginata CBS 339.88]|uniref:Uncharacterized protein n=1 Tax=Galerina marginata (strain CBS 339.88) TaxID=685588 RepID=A0A067TCD6_GALM3|nr:hypothetical protein GALMADRAFT_138633 [Galerina marginata CBS 339.88]
MASFTSARVYIHAFFLNVGSWFGHRVHSPWELHAGAVGGTRQKLARLVVVVPTNSHGYLARVYDHKRAGGGGGIDGVQARLRNAGPLRVIHLAMVGLGGLHIELRAAAVSSHDFVVSTTHFVYDYSQHVIAFNHRLKLSGSTSD